MQAYTSCFIPGLKLNRVHASLKEAVQIKDWGEKHEGKLKKVWVSQKRKSSAKAIKEFKDFLKSEFGENAKRVEWYTRFHDDKPNYWDDSFEIFYLPPIEN